MTSIFSILPIVLMSIIIFIIFSSFFFVGKVRIGSKLKSKLIGGYILLLIGCTIAYFMIADNFQVLSEELYEENHEQYEIIESMENLNEHFVVLEEKNIPYTNDLLTILLSNTYTVLPIYVEKSDQLNNLLKITIYGHEEDEFNLNERVPLPQIYTQHSNLFVEYGGADIKFSLFTKEFPITNFTGERKGIASYKVLEPVKERIIYVQIPEHVEIYNSHNAPIVIVE